MKKILIILTMLLFMPSASEAARQEEVAFLDTRPSVTQPIFLSYDDAMETKQVAILFSGGNGLLRIMLENGLPKIKYPGNFLVRSRNLFVDDGIATILIDCPSDQQSESGMSASFRGSSSHAEDINKVILFAKDRFPGAKVFLVGTSLGTVSVAYLGKTLADRIAGTVLTSAVYEMPAFRLSKLTVPALLVHHRNDGCWVCPYSSAQKTAQSLNLPLITITGNKVLPYPPYPGADSPCEAYSNHGYYGKEKETVDSIVDWLLKQ